MSRRPRAIWKEKAGICSGEGLLCVLSVMFWIVLLWAGVHCVAVASRRAESLVFPSLRFLGRSVRMGDQMGG